GRKNPAGMEPTDSLSPEDFAPVKIPSPELGRGGVAAIWNAERAAHAKSTLGEIQPIADGSTDAIVRPPLDERGIHSSLEDQVFNQPADIVVCKRRADRRAHPEATPQASSHVVLTASFPNSELACG